MNIHDIQIYIQRILADSLMISEDNERFYDNKHF